MLESEAGALGGQTSTFRFCIRSGPDGIGQEAINEYWVLSLAVVPAQKQTNASDQVAELVMAEPRH